MRTIFTIIVILFYTSLLGQQIYKESLLLMGSDFDISVVADTKESGQRHIALAVAEIKRIEHLISSWDSDSQTSQINRSAGLKPVKVDDELFQLIKRSLSISDLTQGAFDISYAAIDQIWKFDGSMDTMPSEEAIKSSVSLVNYKNIILDEDKRSVYLNLKGMKIGFGAIGKGYAADKAKELLKDTGVDSGIINASGDLNAWGTQPNGKIWLVAIVNPLNKNKVFSWLPVHNSAVVTSGNYEKYVTFNNELYTHIIDPRTGYPSKGVLSVSILTKSAELADALATAVFVMGVDTGLNFINQLKHVECIIVDKDNKIHTSNNINLETLN